MPPRLLALLPTFFFLLPSAAQAAWPRHAIDNTLKGADGARLADANNDGLLDIATGWEQSGVVCIYLNPGPAKARQPWPRILFANIKSVEDAILIDLDGDGFKDLVSSCEGNTRSVYVHWAPNQKEHYTDSTKWTVDSIPSAAGREQWMFCAPITFAGFQNPDLIIGSKGAGASISLLLVPRKDPRSVKDWQLRRLADAGWIMSILPKDMDSDGDTDILFSDRRGKLRGVRWLEQRGIKDWTDHLLAARDAEPMFMDARDDIAVSQKEQGCLHLRRLDKSGLRWQPTLIPYPPATGGGKSASFADLNLDGQLDLLLTFEHGNKPGVSGVVYLAGPNWPPTDISGPQGLKYDLAPTLDLDNDGDLDVITTEENDNSRSGKGGLGLIWYENPTKSP